MYRLFAAIEIPRDVGEHLQRLSRGVQGASWRPIENYHITLRFFGDVDTLLARELDVELGRISEGQMQLTIKSIGWFGGSHPHAIWAGVAHCDALTELSSKCERAARRIGLPREKRPFKPHVTLAYCHNTPVDQAVSFQKKHFDLEIGPFWADRFHLYSSWTGKGPSRYVSEAEYPLGH